MTWKMNLIRDLYVIDYALYQLVVEPTHLKHMLVKLDSFPR